MRRHVIFIKCHSQSMAEPRIDPGSQPVQGSDASATCHERKANDPPARGYSKDFALALA